MPQAAMSNPCRIMGKRGASDEKSLINGYRIDRKIILIYNLHYT